MVLPRDKQDIRNARARDKRNFLKVINNIQKVESEEPLEEPLKEPIEEPIEEPKALNEIIEEPLEEPEPEPEPPILTKAEITANKRRASLAFARSQIKPKGFYNDIINKKNQEIETLRVINKTLFEMATLNIKPNIPDKDIPDYIYTEDIKQTQTQQQQQIQQQQIQQQQIQEQQIQQQQQLQTQYQLQPQDYLSNHLYALKLQKDLKSTMTQNMIKNTFG